MTSSTSLCFKGKLENTVSRVEMKVKSTNGLKLIGIITFSKEDLMIGASKKYEMKLSIKRHAPNNYIKLFDLFRHLKVYHLQIQESRNSCSH